MAVAVGGMLWWNWADLAASRASNTGALYALPISVIGGAVVLMIVTGGMLIIGYEECRNTLVKGGLVMLVVTIVLAFTGFRFLNRYGYEVEHRMSAEAVETVRELQPGYEQRIAYPNAVALIERRLDSDAETSPVNASDPHYVMIDGEGKWCSYLTATRQQWRRPLQGIICLKSNGSIQRVAFDGQIPSPEAMFRLNLHRNVAHHARGTNLDIQDVYGYIDSDGNPYLVAPVTRPAGIKHSYRAPAGVVVYESDGTATHHENVAQGEIPGPVVPISIAKDVREAVDARGTFREYFQKKLAFSTTAGSSDDDNGDVMDANAVNPSELLLRNAETGRMEYVTPLTRHGRSTNIVAVTAVVADEVVSGQLPKLRLHLLPATENEQPRLTNSDVVSRIVTRYGLTIPFAKTGEEGQSFRVMEITPSDDPEVWTATIGTANRPVYRIDMHRVTGASCVYNYETGRELRCDAADVVTVPTGALTGTAENPPKDNETHTGEPSTAEPTGDSLTDVPLDELIAERNRIQAEIDRRAATSN